MITLAIDTSNQPMTIAIAKSEQLLGELVVNIKRNHSIQLMPAIESLFQQVEINPKDLELIVVADGPGSYTGLRIGMTTAKTLAWSLNIPIIPISSLKMVAANFIYSDEYIAPFFDARRGNVFTGLYKVNNGSIEEVIEDRHISMEDWLNELKQLQRPIKFVTPSEQNFAPLIKEIFSDEATLIDHFFNIPRASTLIAISDTEERKDPHLVNPRYLKITEAEANWLKNNKKG